MMKRNGWFPYYSSRNNNFSNRQQMGVICVGSSCTLQSGTGVLQDLNPQVNGKSLVRASTSTCQDTTSGKGSSNANGATSCISTQATILTGETQATQEADNDATGDGHAQSCAVKDSSSLPSATGTVEQQVTLAIVLLFVGLFAAWLAYFLYNRYQASKDGTSRFRFDAAWQNSGAAELSASAVTGAAGSRSRASSLQLQTNPSYKGLAKENPDSPKKPASTGASAIRGASSPVPDTAKPGRVLSVKKSRARHEEMI